MENNQVNNKILVYLLVVFFAVFVGSGIFLVFNKNSGEKKEAAATNTIKQEALVMPTVPASEGRLVLKTNESEFSLNQPVTVNLLADSNKKNIVGYDLVIFYDKTGFDFISASSLLPDFQLYSYKKDSYVTFTAIQQAASTVKRVFKETPVASFTFQPKKAGSFIISLRNSYGKEKTDLVTDLTETIYPSLADLTLTVK